MNWEAIGVVTEIIGTLVVIITLIYLAVQVKQGNKQSELESLRHTLDGFNQYCDLIVSSKQTANLLNRGRLNIDNLDEDELMQFEHLHIRFLNTLEGWYRSVQETSRDKQYRAIQEQNIKEAIHAWLNFSGSRAVWHKFEAAFPLITDITNQTLGELDASNATQ